MFLPLIATAIGSATASGIVTKTITDNKYKNLNCRWGTTEVNGECVNCPGGSSTEYTGIVTGIALNSAFTKQLGMSTGLLTVVIGHATFCIVVVYNNAVARLRRMGTSLQEASMDLGANGFTTFRLITLPNMASALLAGALLAFGLSFDEIGRAHV